MSDVSVDPYVFDALMPDLVGHDRRPAAFVVYLYLWRRTGGRESAAVAASLQTLASETGLSKSAVQAALRLLVRRQLVRATRAHATAVPEYAVAKPWLRGRTRERQSAP